MLRPDQESDFQRVQRLIDTEISRRRTISKLRRERGDVTRSRLLKAVQLNPTMTRKELAHELKLTPTQVSRHLGYLEKSGTIKINRKFEKKYNKITSHWTIQILKELQSPPERLVEAEKLKKAMWVERRDKYFRFIAFHTLERCELPTPKYESGYRLGPTALLALLCKFSGTAEYPARKKLATQLGVSKNTITRWVKWLADKGYIAVCRFKVYNPSTRRVKTRWEFGIIRDEERAQSKIEEERRRLVAELELLPYQLEIAEKQRRKEERLLEQTARGLTSFEAFKEDLRKSKIETNMQIEVHRNRLASSALAAKAKDERSLKRITELFDNKFFQPRQGNNTYIGRMSLAARVEHYKDEIRGRPAKVSEYIVRYGLDTDGSLDSEYAWKVRKYWDAFKRLPEWKQKDDAMQELVDEWFGVVKGDESTYGCRELAPKMTRGKRNKSFKPEFIPQKPSNVEFLSEIFIKSDSVQRSSSIGKLA